MRLPKVQSKNTSHTYNTHKHTRAQVRARRMTAKQALSEFLNTFVGGTEMDGKVTRREFFNYYANVGAYVDNDGYFDLLVRGVWGLEAAATRLELPPAPAAPLRSALRAALLGNDVVAQREQPSPALGFVPQGSVSVSFSAAPARQQQQQQQQRRPLSATAPAAAARILSKWSAVPGANHFQDRPIAQTQPQPLPQPLPQHHQPVHLQPQAAPALMRQRPASASAATAATAARGAPPPSRGAPAGRPLPAGLAFMIAQMKAALAAKGPLGYTALHRALHAADTAGGGTLTLAELKRALVAQQLVGKESEARLLFEHFDPGHRGCVPYDALLAALRPPLSAVRAGLVRRAFAALDTGSTGEVAIPAVAGAYNAAKHPDVQAGRMTARQALALFLDSFDAGGEVEGKVTRDEFLTYYTNVGAAVEDDSLFERIVRGVWGLSEGDERGGRWGPRAGPTGLAAGSALDEDEEMSLLGDGSAAPPDAALREEITALKVRSTGA